jgi:hypothetical protein
MKAQDEIASANTNTFSPLLDLILRKRWRERMWAARVLHESRGFRGISAWRTLQEDGGRKEKKFENNKTTTKPHEKSLLYTAQQSENGHMCWIGLGECWQVSMEVSEHSSTDTRNNFTHFRSLEKSKT